MEQAIKDLQFLSKRLKGIVDLGPELENITSLKQVEKECSLRVEESKKHLAAIEYDLVNLQNEKDGVKTAIGKSLRDTDAHIKDLISKAKEEALSITSKANKEYKDKVSSYEDKIKELTSLVSIQEDKVNKLNKEVSDLDDKRNNIKKALEELKGKL